jgi:hypothetical protein
VTVGACATAGALPTAVAPSAISKTANQRTRPPISPLVFGFAPR